MKKKIILIASVILILLILFLPIPRGTYKDGGTKDYCALTYRIVVWNRLISPFGTYHKTSVFWFPDNFKSIDELWEIERNDNSIFNIKFELGNTADNFISIPSEAKAGDMVEIRTGILFDADIHVYVDGQEIEKTHYDSDYWGYSFIMPARDVLITAKHYTKDEVWGTQTITADDLRDKYPAYFDLATDKGLEVYVWQLAPNSYFCGVMEGTNREKTLEELMALKGASIAEMKTILSAYDIPKENISIIPWQNPVSSYMGEYWISPENEDPDAATRRQQQYVERLREMLLDDKPVVTKVSYANWTENSRIFSCLNAEKLAISSVRHLPVYKLDTKEDLDQFREKYRDILSFDQGYDEVPSFNEVTAGYDDSFFAEHTVVLAYVTAGSGSLRFGIRDIYRDDSLFCLNVMQTNTPEVGTADMAGWFMIAEVMDADIEGITDFDSKIVEN